MDDSHLITVGVIPRAHTFPGAKAIFAAEHVGAQFNFTSVHFYPAKDGVEEALTALRVYDMGRPQVVEEMFPIPCGIAQFEQFVDGSQEIVDGYFGHYFGLTIEDYGRRPVTIKAAIHCGFLRFFRDKTDQILGSSSESKRRAPLTAIDSQLEHAQFVAGHASRRTTKLYDHICRRHTEVGRSAPKRIARIGHWSGSDSVKLWMKKPALAGSAA